jgi:hypothetical protein
MAHVHDEECGQLREALESARARQQPPRSAVGITDLANPVRAADPEGETGDVEREIADLQRALNAKGCEP